MHLVNIDFKEVTGWQLRSKRGIRLQMLILKDLARLEKRAGKHGAGRKKLAPSSFGMLTH
jgi:hypothetical protein